MVIDVLLNFLNEFWAVLSDMAPYLLFGFLVAGILSELISPHYVERHLGGRGFWPILKASAVGVPLPLCSCGVIPVAASLRRHGASKGATTAFLMATPQDGVDSILVTFSLLGPVFAIFRPVAALVSGVIGGSLVSIFAHDDAVYKPDEDEEDDSQKSRNPILRMLKYGFVTLSEDIGKSLLIGLVIAALISAFVPGDYFAKYIPPGLGQMLVMMLAGIPVYVCATASVPIAFSLILAGISPGAALVFLMTGPATNAATLLTIWKVMGHKTAVIYLLTVAGTALASGLALDGVFDYTGLVAEPVMGWMLPPVIKSACAVALLGLLAVAIIRPLVSRSAIPVDQQRGSQRIKITGMTCNHCAMAVQRALVGCHGVKAASVHLHSSTAEIVGSDWKFEDLKQAVDELGYEAEQIKQEDQ